MSEGGKGGKHQVKNGGWYEYLFSYLSCQNRSFISLRLQWFISAFFIFFISYKYVIRFSAEHQLKIEKNISLVMREKFT